MHKITVLVLSLSLVLLAGCASYADKKRYEADMKKSSYERQQQQSGKGHSDLNRNTQ